METIIESIFDKLSDQMNNENELFESLQEIMPRDNYKRIEPLINEAIDSEQRKAFILGFKTGVKMLTECTKMKD